MSFAEAIRSCYGKYATFSGRARRSEYWFFQLFFWLVYIAFFALIGVGNAFPQGATRGLFVGLVGLAFIAFVLGSFLPHLSVLVRRLHDGDRSGWWYWIALVPLVGAILLLVWFCTKGTDGSNRYGPDPFDPAHEFK
jgi:uncharacterized membrane protein YhaH (DUF805 family)